LFSTPKYFEVREKCTLVKKLQVSEIDSNRSGSEAISILCRDVPWLRLRLPSFEVPSILGLCSCLLDGYVLGETKDRTPFQALGEFIHYETALEPGGDLSKA
jgi:hypothetical protein